MTGGVTVAYSGVHQAYNLALAAHEIGALDCFFCTLVDIPGKWGRVLARGFGANKMTSRRCPGLPGERVQELPWPWIYQWLRSRMAPRVANDWFAANGWFDRLVARRLKTSTSRVFIGVETCAELSMQVARSHKMAVVLDVPGVDSEQLDLVAGAAAKRLGLPSPRPSDSIQMRRRKRCELDLADVITVCSDLQQTFLTRSGISPARVVTVPLWVDTLLWHPPLAPRLRIPERLRVIFAGKVSVRKGVPFLLEAASELGAACQLTLVGPVEPELDPILRRFDGNLRLLKPQTKEELRRLHWEHDVFVLPSLGDSFGFAALEAMACGLPVIVTENCGVPVPDRSWIVPAMNSGAIARRLKLYLKDPLLLSFDEAHAEHFARLHTPERYRARIQQLMRELLHNLGKID